MPHATDVRLQFNEAKAAQAAARLLRSHGGKMNYMKLIKLLYLVDRETLRQWGRPVSTDCYVSMDKGPVLGGVLDLINYGAGPNAKGPWCNLIAEPHSYQVSLLSNEDPPDGELSNAEERVIDDIDQRFGSKSPWELVELVHNLPEWIDPNGSARAISYGEILKAVGKSDDEIDQIESELRAANEVDLLLV